MGMYTELHFNSELSIKKDSIVADILKYMIGDVEEPPEMLPDHKLFKSSRWMVMLQTDSYYFDADTVSTLRWDEGAGSYFLCIRCNLKNYDSEIEKFVDWIMPYLDEYKEDGDFLGFYRYEEDEEPTIIRFAQPQITELGGE